MNNKAIILLSGGLDSTTCLALAMSQGIECHTMAFQYGNLARHAEIRASERVATALGAASYRCCHIDVSPFASASSLTGGQAIPTGRTDEEIGAGIPSTYVPARNIIFLSYALGLADALGADQIWIGVNALDYSGYPDCRPDFIAAFQAAARLGTRSAELEIVTPLEALTKKDIVELAVSLRAPLDLTSTCYQPRYNHSPCGSCDACLLRARGFEAAGVADPLTTRRGSR